MEIRPVDMVLARPKSETEKSAPTPQFLFAQALRYRCLAAKVRREANTVVGDPVAPRLFELAEKLEGDAICDEEKARILSAARDGETWLRQHD